MNRKINWRPVYVLFALLAVLLLLVGQWGAGVTTLILTVALSQLVRIGNALEVMTNALHESGDAAGGSAAQGFSTARGGA